MLSDGRTDEENEKPNGSSWIFSRDLDNDILDRKENGEAIQMNLQELTENLYHLRDVTAEIEHDDLERLARFIENNYSISDYIQLTDEIASIIRDEEDSFFGTYESEADFAETFYSDTEPTIPSWVVVDWLAPFDYSLQYDFIYESGYVWRNC